MAEQGSGGEDDSIGSSAGEDAARQSACVIDVSEWPEQEDPDEPLGARGSTWLVKPDDPEGRPWIFKPVRTRTVVHPADPECFEEDWAEYVATRIGVLLGLPVAEIGLATRHGRRGVISPSFVRDRAHPPTYGNELLFRADPSHPLKAKGEVVGYTPQRCLELLGGHRAPLGAMPALHDAVDAFASYLLLDALVANTDRHHENWAVLQYRGSSYLAPCYDLGTSLGFQLTDGERRERLATADMNRTVKAWTERGTSRTFEGNPSLVEVAVTAFHAASEVTRSWLLERLAELHDDHMADVIAAVPADRMTQWAGRFAIRILQINRDRLLEKLS